MSLASIEDLRQSDSSSSPPSSRDRLTTLPPELFDYICDIVSQHPFVITSSPRRLGRTYLGGVSRVFLHKARVRHFRRIVIKTTSRLLALYTTIALSPGCRPYVEELSLQFDQPVPEDWLLNEQLVSFLDSLPSLLTLRVKQYPRLTRLLVDPPRWSHFLSTLKELDLADRFPDWEDPFNPIHLMNLDYYPNLDSFNFGVCTRKEQRPGYRSLPCIKGSSIEVYPNLSVRTLRLVGWISLSPSLVTLYQHFPNLTTLSLEEPSTKDGHLSKALKAFPFPTSLEYLAIQGDLTWDPSLGTALSKFTALENLRLFDGTYDSTLVPILRNGFKNLRNLHIQVEINAEDLRDVFESNKTLESLYIASIAVTDGGRTGTRLSPISDAHIETVLGLVALASMNGVELDGPAIWDADDYKERKARLAEAKASGRTYERLRLDEIILGAADIV
ncbi:hypothetical protein JCM5353_002256 [Sporobolomyces roseus]